MPTIAVPFSDDAATRAKLVQGAFANERVRVGEPGSDPVRDLMDGMVHGLVLPLAEARKVASEEGVLCRVIAREDPRDVLVSAGSRPLSIETIDPGGRVLVTGEREATLLRARRRDLEIAVVPDPDHAVEALRNGEASAVVGRGTELAHRGGGDSSEQWLEQTAWLPPAGRGVLAVLHMVGRGPWGPTPEINACVVAEETVAEELGDPGPHVVGVVGIPFGHLLRLWGLVVSADGRRAVRADITGAQASAEFLGLDLTDILAERGAPEILEER